MDEETASAWSGEAFKAIVTGGVTTSIFGVAGGFIGFAWFEDETGSNVCIPSLGCEPPELPLVGPVTSPMQAAFWFGLLLAVLVLVVCGGFVAYKSHQASPRS